MNTAITILQNGLFNWQKENKISSEELLTGIRSDIREPARLLNLKQQIFEYN